MQMALLLSPVATSEKQMLEERENVAKEVGDFISWQTIIPLNIAGDRSGRPEQTVQHIHMAPWVKP